MHESIHEDPRYEVSINQSINQLRSSNKLVPCNVIVRGPQQQDVMSSFISMHKYISLYHSYTFRAMMREWKVRRLTLYCSVKISMSMKCENKRGD